MVYRREQGRKGAESPGRVVRRYIQTGPESRRERAEGEREEAGIYASQCTLTALVELAGESVVIAEAAACGGGPIERIFEPFAFVVCRGCLSQLAEARRNAARIPDGSALPMKYGRALGPEANGGE